MHHLTEIEAIKALKARYFRLMDTKRWDEWSAVFTEDCTMWVADQPDVTYHDRAAFLAAIPPLLADAVTVHHGHMPEITIDVPAEGAVVRTASGIWAMFDYVQLPPALGNLTLNGYGHYHETYCREGEGPWQISSLRLERLRVDIL